MFKHLGALLAVLFTLIAGPAFAGTSISSVAACTRWSLEHTVNPFYKDGRTGITEAEARRLPLSTRMALPDGSFRLLEPRGAHTWGLCKELVASGWSPKSVMPAAATPEAKPQPEAKPTPAPAGKAEPQPDVSQNAAAIEAARLAAEQAAKRASERKAIEQAQAAVSALQTVQVFASNAKEAAATATGTSSVIETRIQATEARKAATDAANAVAEVREAAEAATTHARSAGTEAAQVAEGQARTAMQDANAALKAANADADRAELELETIVTDWLWTNVLIALGYAATIMILFSFFPRVFNFLFGGFLKSEGWLSTLCMVVILPALIPFSLIKRKRFYREHYPYLCETEEEPACRYDLGEKNGTADPDPGLDNFRGAKRVLQAVPVSEPAPYKPPPVRSPTVHARRPIPTPATARRRN